MHLIYASPVQDPSIQILAPFSLKNLIIHVTLPPNSMSSTKWRMRIRLAMYITRCIGKNVCYYHGIVLASLIIQTSCKTPTSTHFGCFNTSLFIDSQCAHPSSYDTLLDDTTASNTDSSYST